VELRSSRMSDEPEAGGEAESSLSSLILFMATRTEAASSSWTCWCLEMSSLEVYCHSGVCSQLEQKSTLFCSFLFTSRNKQGLESACRAFVSSGESMWAWWKATGY
jgi:hypothetical protein